MKKLVATLIATSMLVGMGTVSAQASHDVTVSIPQVMMIRIVDGSNASAPNPSVIFNIDASAYAALFEGDGTGGQLASTSAPDFGDVIVFSTMPWRVNVSASETGDGWVGLSLADISVVPSNTPGDNVTESLTTWNLATTTNLFVGRATRGWRSLGFSGMDYSLTVNGEESGTYTASVTYTIAAP
jgi:hypothetical protein